MYSTLCWKYGVMEWLEILSPRPSKGEERERPGKIFNWLPWKIINTCIQNKTSTILKLESCKFCFIFIINLKIIYVQILNFDFVVDVFRLLKNQIKKYISRAKWKFKIFNIQLILRCSHFFKKKDQIKIISRM